uniref:Uncharacterized protein n=2 Tax=Ursus TaxID=9639 RepID=A0A452TS06_URSMA
MKKKLKCMKQLANQTVGRTKKTEDLCEDMSQLRLHLDMVQSMCQHFHKCLMVCFQGQHAPMPEEAQKRNVDSFHSEYAQSISLVRRLSLREMVDTCGDAENQLVLELF